MPRFRVTFCRTNITNGSIVVGAKNASEAEDKVRKMADGGKFGLVKWTLKDAAQAVKEADIDSEEEIIDIEEAIPEDE
jgi:hypothetical protein